MEDIRSCAYKARDSWWTVVLVDPLAGPLVRLTANRTSITPNQLSAGGLVFGLGAAACFLAADPKWLIGGAVLYHLSFTLDCMDGKIARIKGTGTVFGEWLDYVLDRIRVLVCALALASGQFTATGNPAYLYLGIGIVFLDMFRYLDALKVGQTRRKMRRDLMNTHDPPTSRPAPDGSSFIGNTEESSDLHLEFKARFSWYLPVREWLRRRRIRSHLVSGIEFQMAAFVVGPLLNSIIPVTIGAGLLMLVFECAIVYKLWLSSKDFARVLDEIQEETCPVFMAPDAPET
jgi:hypothetical protein